MNEELFNDGLALTFDDVLVLPGYSDALPREIDIGIRLTPSIYLNAPILSAAMDRVTKARMAIALAREGALGIIHRNMSAADQAAEVDKVKRSQSGMIVDPITLPINATVAEAEQLMSKFHISGIPITDEQGKLLGILTNRDVRFLEGEEYQRPVHEFMTHRPLVTAHPGITLDQAKDLLQEHRIEKLPLVDEEENLKGLITVKDIKKEKDYPNAAKDEGGRLLVGAAVGVSDDLEQRVEKLVNADVDIVVIDTAHGHSDGVIRAIQRIRSGWSSLPIIAGNVVTSEGTEALIEAGANVIKVGVGAGSICTTRIIAGVGMPQLSAIHNCASIAHAHGVSVIADGGIRYSGDIVKAIACGADAVMLGNLLAGLEESPGETILFEGRRYKEYRGMGSLGVMGGYSSDRYSSAQDVGAKLVPEGIEGRVPYKGSLQDYIFQLLGGLRSGMGYAGAICIEDLSTKARMVRITNAGFIESHPHDVVLTKEPPNYQVPGSAWSE